METQHGILATLWAALPALSVTVEAHRDQSRRALGGRVCEAFGFVDARGRLQRARCVKALRVLEGAGRPPSFGYSGSGAGAGAGRVVRGQGP